VVDLRFPFLKNYQRGQSVASKLTFGSSRLIRTNSRTPDSGCSIVLLGRFVNESNPTIDWLFRVLVPNDIAYKYREPPWRKCFSRNLHRLQGPPPMADDVAILRFRTNAIIVCSRDKESFVLIVPLPVPQISVPPGPDPRSDWNVQSRFFK
jgi:hypothetical protein